MCSRRRRTSYETALKVKAWAKGPQNRCRERHRANETSGGQPGPLCVGWLMAKNADRESQFRLAPSRLQVLCVIVPRGGVCTACVVNGSCSFSTLCLWLHRDTHKQTQPMKPRQQHRYKKEPRLLVAGGEKVSSTGFGVLFRWLARLWRAPYTYA